VVGEFVQQVENTVKDILNEVHTVLPGTITAVNTDAGTVTVTPVGKYKTSQGKYIDFPAVSGVPLVIPQSTAAGIEIAYPVAAGDTCLLLFAEQELDSFLYGGASNMTLRFDLTSAIAIPGLCKIAGTAWKEACSSQAVVIRNGEMKLTVAKDGVAVQGNLKVNGNINCSGIVYGTIPGL